MSIYGYRAEIMRRFKNSDTNLQFLSGAISQCSSFQKGEGSTELDEADLFAFAQLFTSIGDSYLDVAKRLDSLKSRYLSAQAQFKPPRRVTPEPTQVTENLFKPIKDPMPIDETLELE